MNKLLYFLEHAVSDHTVPCMDKFLPILDHAVS
jgi:hypothetical protein